MSQSPAESNEADGSYRSRLKALDRLIENGESWSGKERNSAFLNLGRSKTNLSHGERHSTAIRFAPAAAVLGLDFLDDGRAHAVVDWDGDGDLDLWTTNRTSPRVRFLLNRGARDNGYLAIRLTGTSCNRDAIGSVVTVEGGAQELPDTLVRVLRAGEGFLSQSSKWLHFGLGPSSSISTVHVDWPNGERQTFRNLQPNRRYWLTQGDATPAEVTRPVAVELHPGHPVAQGASDAAAILLSSRLPMPPIPYRSLDDNRDLRVANGEGGRPLWLTLFASWCHPCIDEMREMAAHKRELNDAGLSILSLSLDGLSEATDATGGGLSTTVADARRLIAEIDYPFFVGAADDETVRRLQVVGRILFGRKAQIGLPFSCLISGDGQLAAIYRGPVSIERAVADAKTIQLDEESLLKKSLPFPGVWFDGRRRLAPLELVADLIDHGFDDDAYDYVQAHQRELVKQPGFAEVVGALGTKLASQGKSREARFAYRLALREDPRNVPVLNNFAWHLATNDDSATGRLKEAIGYAELAAKLTGYRSSSILDTLATCYATDGQHAKALKILDLAMRAAEAAGNDETLQRLRDKHGQVRRHVTSDAD